MSISTAENKITINLRRPHEKQAAFIDCEKKRIVVRGGRRGGKTTGIAIRHIKRFLQRRRQLYAAPTQEQVGRFWYEVVLALKPAIDAGVLYKNESLHVIEFPGTEARLRAKTAWNADTLRGDYADDVTLDEWQLMDENAWALVVAPMLLDNNGDACFIYTPPSLHARSTSKAKDPLHAPKMYKKALQDDRWAAFHFRSHDNPYISREALLELTHDMTSLAYRQEIEAEDMDEAPGALWTRATIEQNRMATHPDLVRIVVGVDPPGGATECGIIIAGRDRDDHLYVIGDSSLQASPDTWGAAVVKAYDRHSADRVLGEKNFGGDMVESTIKLAAKSRGLSVSYKAVTASRGKAVRAEPIAAQYEQGKVHHVGRFDRLEDEMTMWEPGGPHSPNRMDALVWALTEITRYTAGAPRSAYL